MGSVYDGSVTALYQMISHPYFSIKTSASTYHVG